MSLNDAESARRWETIDRRTDSVPRATIGNGTLLTWGRGCCLVKMDESEPLKRLGAEDLPRQQGDPMVATPIPTDAVPDVLFVFLPGPDRKRSAASYGYRLTYRNSDRTGAGCVMLWEVAGGRLPYQIALERDEAGSLQFHCTCADAIFRAESEGRHCKHIRGLLEIGTRGTERPSLGPDAQQLTPGDVVPSRLTA